MFFDAFFGLLIQGTLLLNVAFSSTFDSTFIQVLLQRLKICVNICVQQLVADPVHVFSLPVFLQVDHHEKDVAVARDEDVLVLHLDVVELLEGVFEEAGHSSYGTAHLKGLEKRCYKEMKSD